MTLTVRQANLPGEWRHRRLSGTDAHLFFTKSDESKPACGRRIPRSVTVSARDRLPCRECLIADIHSGGGKEQRD